MFLSRFFKYALSNYLTISLLFSCLPNFDRTTAVYGGAGVAEQIADLKRGVHICVGTPGRMIDILTMQAGKILSLQRVSYVVLDEVSVMNT